VNGKNKNTEQIPGLQQFVYGRLQFTSSTSSRKIRSLFPGPVFSTATKWYAIAPLRPMASSALACNWATIFLLAKPTETMVNQL